MIQELRPDVPIIPLAMGLAEPLDHDLFSLFDVSWASEQAGLEQYMERVLANCASWFDASGVSLFLAQSDGQYLLAAQTGSGSRVPEGTVLSTEGIAGASIAAGKPMLVQDPTEQPHRFGKVKVRKDLSSAMVVPLITPESGRLGVLNVSRVSGAAPYEESDLQKAASFASQIALAISNARLFARMNRAINESRVLNEKLDSIIRSLGVGVLVVNQHGELTEWNPEAARLLKNEPARGEMLEAALGSCPAHIREGLTRLYEERAAGPHRLVSEGGRSWLVVGTALSSGGMTFALQDVTEQERAQEELSRMKRLAEIGQMTAAIAHEIRNPLTGIRSAAQMVQSLEGEGAEFGQIVEEEALKLNRLCDEFLDFAKPLQLHCQHVCLPETVHSVVESMKSDFCDRGVAVAVEIDGVGPTINSDPLRLEQVLRNLLRNSLQASGEGGMVSVAFSGAKLRIKDNGMGMDSETLDRLFTPFFTTKANGTGLGLSTVRKIVEAHGWSISVESVPERGTSFTIDFGGAA